MRNEKKQALKAVNSFLTTPSSFPPLRAELREDEAEKFRVTFPALLSRLKEIYEDSSNNRKIVDIQFRGPRKNLDFILKTLEEKPEAFSLDHDGEARLRQILQQYSEGNGVQAVSSVNHGEGSRFNQQEFLALLVYFVEGGELTKLKPDLGSKRDIFVFLGGHSVEGDLKTHKEEFERVVRQANAQNQGVIFLIENTVPLEHVVYYEKQNVPGFAKLTDEEVADAVVALLRDREKGGEYLSRLVKNILRPTEHYYQQQLDQISSGQFPTSLKDQPQSVVERTFFPLLLEHQVKVYAELAGPESWYFTLLSHYFRDKLTSKAPGGMEEHLKLLFLYAVASARAYIHRDEIAVQQINQVKKEHPNSYVVVFRGLLHDGIISELQNQGYQFRGVVSPMDKWWEVASPEQRVIRKIMRQIRQNEFTWQMDSENRGLLMKSFVSWVAIESLLPLIGDTLSASRVVAEIVEKLDSQQIMMLWEKMGKLGDQAGTREFVLRWLVENESVSNEHKELLKRALDRLIGENRSDSGAANRSEVRAKQTNDTSQLDTIASKVEFEGVFEKAPSNYYEVREALKRALLNLKPDGSTNVKTPEWRAGILIAILSAISQLRFSSPQKFRADPLFIEYVSVLTDTLPTLIKIPEMAEPMRKAFTEAGLINLPPDALGISRASTIFLDEVKFKTVYNILNERPRFEAILPSLPNEKARNTLQNVLSFLFPQSRSELRGKDSRESRGMRNEKKQALKAVNSFLTTPSSFPPLRAELRER
ncbi:MAG: hypothetical protein HY583_00790, partial [Candidatus Omnitrophica bacterium]|nr:hypothetical protein [Candidatus Omnitrophota bacterium]